MRIFSTKTPKEKLIAAIKKGNLADTNRLITEGASLNRAELAELVGGLNLKKKTHDQGACVTLALTNFCLDSLLNGGTPVTMQGGLRTSLQTDYVSKMAKAENVGRGVGVVVGCAIGLAFFPLIGPFASLTGSGGAILGAFVGGNVGEKMCEKSYQIDTRRDFLDKVLNTTLALIEQARKPGEIVQEEGQNMGAILEVGNDTLLSGCVSGLVANFQRQHPELERPEGAPALSAPAAALATAAAAPGPVGPHTAAASTAGVDRAYSPTH